MAWLLQREGIPLAFGGLIFNNIPALPKRIPGHFLGERLDLVAAVVQQIFAAAHSVPAVAKRSPTYQEALDHYQERQASIEAEIWQLLKPAHISQIPLINAHINLSQNIVAALTLGDIEFMDDTLVWLEGLLMNYQLSSAQLYEYLNAYTKAA
jgi:hypothetical protein